MTGELNGKEKEVLALGHNFNLMNRTINNKTLTVDIEKTCRTARILESKKDNTLNTLSSQNKIFAKPQFEVPRIIPKKGSDQLEQQLSKIRYIILRNFKQNHVGGNVFDKRLCRTAKKIVRTKDIAIKKADKGGALVVMTREVYINKVNEHNYHQS